MGTIFLAVVVIFGPFMTFVFFVGIALYALGHVLRQVTRYYISKGHALDANSVIPQMHIKNPLIKIVDELGDAIVPLTTLLVGVGSINVLYWADIFFP